jgi:hypothetical protein
MSAHPPQLSRQGQTTTSNTTNTLLVSSSTAAVAPHPARHVVARAEQQIGQVRRPGHPPDGVVVALEELQRTRGLADIEGADDAVDTRDGDDGAAVLVPIVRERFAGRQGRLRFARRHAAGASRNGRRVDRHAQLQMIAGAGRGAQVPEPKLRVAGHRADEAFGVRAPLCRVGAAVCGEGEHAALALRVPDLDRAIPGGGGEGGFGGQVPGAGEGFPRVFVVGCDGEAGLEAGVEEAEGAVTARGEQVGRMCFRVAEVVQCILSRIPADSMRIYLSVRGAQSCARRAKHINIYHLRARIPCGVNSKT